MGHSFLTGVESGPLSHSFLKLPLAPIWSQYLEVLLEVLGNLPQRELRLLSLLLIYVLKQVFYNLGLVHYHRLPTANGLPLLRQPLETLDSCEVHLKPIHSPPVQAWSLTSFLFCLLNTVYIGFGAELLSAKTIFRYFDVLKIKNGHSDFLKSVLYIEVFL